MEFKKYTAIWDSMISWANLKGVVLPISSKSPAGRTEARAPKKSNVPEALEGLAPEVLGTWVFGSKGG